MEPIPAENLRSVETEEIVLAAYLHKEAIARDALRAKDLRWVAFFVVASIALLMASSVAAIALAAVALALLAFDGYGPSMMFGVTEKILEQSRHSDPAAAILRRLQCTSNARYDELVATNERRSRVLRLAMIVTIAALIAEALL